jgi:hypothetical protein
MKVAMSTNTGLHFAMICAAAVGLAGASIAAVAQAATAGRSS